MCSMLAIHVYLFLLSLSFFFFISLSTAFSVPPFLFSSMLIWRLRTCSGHNFDIIWYVCKKHFMYWCVVNYNYLNLWWPWGFVSPVEGLLWWFIMTFHQDPLGGPIGMHHLGLAMLFSNMAAADLFALTVCGVGQPIFWLSRWVCSPERRRAICTCSAPATLSLWLCTHGFCPW